MITNPCQRRVLVARMILTQMAFLLLQRKDYPTHLCSYLAITLHMLRELALEGEGCRQGLDGAR